jgi:hypothetical protein
MKYLKLFEDFDLDKFLDDPDSQMGDQDSPEIEPGDWIKSYRGIGQVLDITEDFYRVQLTGSKSAIVNIPKFSATKVGRPEKDEFSKTIDKMNELIQILDEYIQALAPEEGEETINNPESVLDYIEQDVLLELILLVKTDPDTGSYGEFDQIVTKVALLIDLIIEADPDLLNRAVAVQDKFYEMAK